MCVQITLRLSTAGDSSEVPRLPKFKNREVNTVSSYMDSVVQGYQKITTKNINKWAQVLY